MKTHLLKHWGLGLFAAIFSLLCLPGGAQESTPTWALEESDHKIAPLEIIRIDVFGEESLSKEFRVQASGKITFPLLLEVEVAGKTTTEVENELKELLITASQTEFGKYHNFSDVLNGFRKGD